MTFLCLLLGWTCYRLFTDRGKGRAYESSLHKEWIEEKKEIVRFLTDVLNVLNCNVGGISKRISESAEIAEAIQSKAPDLFRQCFGLAHWLHANDQFLVSLYTVAEEGIEQVHQRRVHEMKKNRREEVFNRIYDGARLSAPSIRTN